MNLIAASCMARSAASPGPGEVKARLPVLAARTPDRPGGQRLSIERVEGKAVGDLGGVSPRFEIMVR